MEKVKVYRFTKWNIESGKTELTPRSATLDAIAEFGGTPILDTGQEVDPRCVDGNGFLLHTNS